MSTHVPIRGHTNHNASLTVPHLMSIIYQPTRWGWLCILNKSAIPTFQSESVDTYHPLIWRAAAGLSCQVQPERGSHHAKHCLFPGSWWTHTTQVKTQVSDLLLKNIVTGKMQKHEPETTWSNPALIRPPHLPAPWEASQSLSQCWRVQQNQIIVTTLSEKLSMTWRIPKTSSDKDVTNSSWLLGDRWTGLLPFCCRPTHNRLFIFQSHQQLFCKRTKLIPWADIFQYHTFQTNLWRELTDNSLHVLGNVVVLLLFLYLHLRSHSGSDYSRLWHGEVRCQGAVASLIPEKH